MFTIIILIILAITLVLLILTLIKVGSLSNKIEDGIDEDIEDIFGDKE